jgi:Zn-dependent peptidase ImmA (M78 family)/DNA-binding XRE family transcriptional regulator
MNRRPAQYYLSQLDPARITAARELRGFTKAALAERLDKSASAVSLFESGKSGLDIETFVRLSMTLEVPPSFFSSNEFFVNTDSAACHFRAKQSIPQCTRKSALRYVHCVFSIYAALEKRGIVFPEPALSAYDFPAYSPRGIEELGNQVRSQWDLGTGPIHNMMSLLESKGIFVILLDARSCVLDAFSSHEACRPYIALNYTVPASRIQFDLGHELAHLLLHEDISTGDSETERAANHFAGAFLAPASVFKEEHPPQFSYIALRQLKERWHISMLAALYRARQIGIITESSFRWGMVQLSKQRKEEPYEFEKTPPSLLRQGLDLLKGELTLEELADEVCLHPNEVEHILITQQIPNEIIEEMKSRPKKDILPEVLRITSR